MPKEESCPIPLKHIDVTRTTHTSLDVLLEKHNDDYWNADGERELSDAWTGFTWSRERLTRKQTTSRPDNVWPDFWEHMSDAAKKNAKQRRAIEKPKFDNARQLRGIFFIEPYDARRKLEVPMPAAMPSKIPANCRGETYRNIGKKQDQICLYCRCRRIYENTTGRSTAQVSRRSHCCKRNKFIEPLQLGT